jgi:GxxExxY protein
MPIHCPLNIEKICTEAFGALDYTVMGHMFASQNDIGRLADERIYQADVAQRLDAAGITSEIEAPINLVHKTFFKKLSLDLVVSQKAVNELKTVSALNSNHVAQLLTYLYLLDLPRGKLVNFRSPSIESKFVNAPIPREERRGFSLKDGNFYGDRNFLHLVIDLVRDWGTSLSVTLYRQALVNLLGGEGRVERMLPLSRSGICLANQRFHLLSDNSAFELTAFAKLDNEGYRDQLQRLLELSPLTTLERINIGSHCVTFQTLERT